MDILDHDIIAQQALLKRYKASIDMARIPVFILTGYLLLQVGVYFYKVRDLDYQIIRPYISVVIRQAGVEFAIVLAAIFSYYRTYIGMLLLLIMVSLIIVFGTGYDVYLYFAAHVKPTVLSLIVIVPVIIEVLLIRAVADAKKYERVKKQIAAGQF